MRFACLACSALSLLLFTGCKSDTRPVPHIFGGGALYDDYRKQPRSFPMTPEDANAVLIRTDLKTTGDFIPPDAATGKAQSIRFIYGGKYYWAYESRPRAVKEMYGPFELP